MYVYHKEIGFPSTLTIPDLVTKLHYTKHALDRRTRENKYQNLKVLPGLLRIHKHNVIEVHTIDNVNVKKAVVRTKYDKFQDIVLVLELFPGKTYARVITFYLNKKHDSHKTLNRERYNKPMAA
jgi:hypothetical protein